MAKSKNTSIILGKHFDSFVTEQVEAGRYGNASEVVRDALRLLEKENTKFEALKAALIKGEESGPSEPFDPEAFKEKMLKKHAKDV